MNVHFALAQLFPSLLRREPRAGEIREEEEREIPAGQPAGQAEGCTESAGDELRLPLALGVSVSVVVVVIVIMMIVIVMIVIVVRPATGHRARGTGECSGGGFVGRMHGARWFALRRVFVMRRIGGGQDRRRLSQERDGAAPSRGYGAAVILYFAETEQPVQEFFTARFPEHDLRFVAKLAEVGADAEIVSGFTDCEITEDFLETHGALRLIATCSTATDHIAVAACRARGITVCHVPAYGDTTVAEHTFALVLALSRRLRETMLTPTHRKFSYAAVRGFDLCGKTIGIIGAGHIGRRVAVLAQAFRMEVLACDVATSSPEAGMQFVPLDELLARAQIVTLHAPLTDATRHLINRETLAKCPRGVILINTARGGLIDTAALREALDSGQVGGAGLDVLEDERVLRAPASAIIAGEIVAKLQGEVDTREAHDAGRLAALQEVMLGDAILSKPNVVFTPHVAFNSVEAFHRLLETTAENIQAFVAGKPIHVVA